MASELDRQRWLDVFWKSIAEPASQVDTDGQIVSREVWLDEFWRSHDKAARRLRVSDGAGELASSHGTDGSAMTKDRVMADDKGSGDSRFETQSRVAAKDEGEPINQHLSRSAD